MINLAIPGVRVALEAPQHVKLGFTGNGAFKCSDVCSYIHAWTFLDKYSSTTGDILVRYFNDLCELTVEPTVRLLVAPVDAFKNLVFRNHSIARLSSGHVSDITHTRAQSLKWAAWYGHRDLSPQIGISFIKPHKVRNSFMAKVVRSNCIGYSSALRACKAVFVGQVAPVRVPDRRHKFRSKCTSHAVKRNAERAEALSVHTHEFATTKAAKQFCSGGFVKVFEVTERFDYHLLNIPEFKSASWMNPFIGIFHRFFTLQPMEPGSAAARSSHRPSVRGNYFDGHPPKRGILP